MLVCNKTWVEVVDIEIDIVIEESIIDPSQSRGAIDWRSLDAT